MKLDPIEREQRQLERLYRKRPDSVERQEQSAYFTWLAYAETEYPQLAGAYHPANEGKRSVVGGRNLKRAGMRPGILDVHLPCAALSPRNNRVYIGLWLEFKTEAHRNDKSGGLSDDQLCWATLLHDLGHCVWPVYNWEEAREVTLAYLRDEL